MKIKKPMTPADHFAAAREIIASSNYKIFTPNWRYFRQKLQLVATKSYVTKNLFLLQLRNNILVVNELPPSYGDRGLVHKIAHELGIHVTVARPLPRLGECFDPWDAARLYIKPSEQAEFDLFVKENLNARLP